MRATPPSHQQAQGSQDTLTHFVIPRTALPLLSGQFEHLAGIFGEERRHLPGELRAVDPDIDFIVADQAQPVEVACADRRPLPIDGAGLCVQHGVAVAKDAHAASHVFHRFR